MACICCRGWSPTTTATARASAAVTSLSQTRDCPGPASGRTRMRLVRRYPLRALFAASLALLLTAVMERSPHAQAPFEVLHVFSGGADGAVALGSLIDGGDGFFYGTTQYGGAFNRGTVYR